MAKQDFRKNYHCEFAPDQRYIALCKRLQLYYEQTPDWKEFKAWCDEHGYEKDEINRAKRDMSY